MALILGLTGGIGSGKTAVSDRLGSLGAAIVDADLVARDIVKPEGQVLGQLVERFGPEILVRGGTLDREALALMAFIDPESTKALNDITHPAIGIAMVQELERASADSAIVVMAIPLLRQLHIDAMGLQQVVVVDCPEDIALERLISKRAMQEDDARARIGAQISRRERLVLADHIIDNSADLAWLNRQVDGLWEQWQGEIALA
ncbi:MAG: dephospho-CoA kinase [Actinobacteria bacterium]|nr:dephospho-CoA kinase [Actinomycetota bacterium]